MTPPDLSMLRTRFGAEGRIAFRSGTANLPIVALAGKYGACEISLHGGHVLSYLPVGLGPVLFMSRQSAFEPGKAIRGGIPVCWPWFSVCPFDPQQPKHGFVRVRQWELASTEYSGESTSIQLTMRDSESTRRIWDYAFHLTLEIRLSQQLDLVLTTENRDTKPFTFSQAFHPYFLVRDITACSVLGLDQARYGFQLTGQDQVHQGPLTFTGPIDHLFTPEKNELAIHDQKLRRATLITYSGTRNVIVWNPWIEGAKTFSDLADDEYQQMLCVEPTNIKDTEILLAPGERHTLKMSIQARLT